jgi:5-methyltetrahydrofolate--homocysteine methyltransferase
VRPEELRALLGKRVLLLDGGMGSLLMAAGLERGRAPEWWNLEHPERIEAAHRGYVEAGSDVVHTNSFGASPPKLKAAGLAGRCREVTAAAMAIARTACRASTLVAGDVGPTGLLLPPVGQTSVEEIADALREQVGALAEAGADLISIETMYDLREALAAVGAARATGLPVLASMTFESRKRGFFTIMGDPLGASLAALADAGADAVGFNCSVTSSVMLGMVAEARRSVSAPVVAQPNAGQPRVTAEGTTYDASPEEFARDVVAMVEAGARLVGGCCGTTPEFIACARAALTAAEAT